MILLLVLVLVMLQATPSLGATYWTSTIGTGSCVQASTGNCAPNGTGGSCARGSINAGIACLSGGDTLIVQNGVYDELIADYAGIGGHTVRPPSGSSWSAPTTIKAQHKHGATIQESTPPSGWVSVIFLDGVEQVTQFISFEGFVLSNRVGRADEGSYIHTVVTGGNATDIRFQDIRVEYPVDIGFKTYGGTHRWQFLNVDVIGTAKHPVTGANTCAACGLPHGQCFGECHPYYVGAPGDGGSGHLWDGGTLDFAWGWGFYQSAWNCTIRNLTIKGMAQAGILLTGGNNIVYNTTITGSGGGIASGTSGQQIYHNTIHGNATQLEGAGQFGISISNSSGLVVKNNIVTQQGGSGAAFDLAGGEIGGNLCDQSGNAHCELISATPSPYVNAAAGDFHLTATSPAINRGVSTPVSLAQDGAARSGAPDVGAFEFVSGGTPVATTLVFGQQPTNVALNTNMSPPVTVRVLDQTGALYTTPVSIGLALGANPGGGSLSVTTPQTTVNGVATFSNIQLNAAGMGKTLVASASGLPSVTSTSFNVPSVPVLAAPASVRLLETTTGATGQVRVGWNYTPAGIVATGFSVYKQPACSGAFAVQPQMPMPALLQTGVVLSGAERGTALPGTHGTDYVYPDAQYATSVLTGQPYTGQTYFADKGMTTARLLFKHERLQRTLGGELDSAELNRLETTVAHIVARGMHVILTPDNAARYTIGGTTHLVGSATYTNAHFADLWRRLAEWFFADAANPTNFRVLFDLTNEPHTMPTETWRDAAQAAINAIRTTGAENPILVQGNGRSHGFNWTATCTYGTCNGTALLTLNDPLPNVGGMHLAYSIHEFFDALTLPVGEGECVSATIGTERLQPFTTWLRANNKKGHLGAWGVRNTATCQAVQEAVTRHIRDNSDVYTGQLWYAGGPWWPDAFVLQLEPEVGPVDTPQMDRLEPYLAEEGTVQQHYTEGGLALGSTTCYKVRAVDKTGAESADSNVLAVTIGAPPPPPTNLTATPRHSGLFLSR